MILFRYPVLCKKFSLHVVSHYRIFLLSLLIIRVVRFWCIILLLYLIVIDTPINGKSIIGLFSRWEQQVNCSYSYFAQDQASARYKPDIWKECEKEMFFYTISDSISFELIEKKSRFICILSPLIEPQDVEDSLQVAGQRFPGARHYCFAYRLRQDGVIMERCSDDGEPSGTAGSPILNVLQKRELENIIAVVVRYFGGTLLGTGGLVRAYTQVVQSAVKEARIVSQEYSQKILITLDYSHYGSFEQRFLKSLNQVSNIEYADRISIEAWIALEKLPRFMAEVDNLTGGTASIELLGKGFVPRC
ncbi:MAG: IMPACT family protein [Syntrophomonadaceae bacterium]|nr:DUF1949 domain-containing protein [Syntrophomonadaceae bacterium]